MKKIIALLLTLVMMFSLCGCGKSDGAKSNDVTKDEKLKNPSMFDVSKDKRFENPVRFDETKFPEVYERNKVNAKDEYIGNVYRLRAYIYEIEEEYIIVYTIPNDKNIKYSQVSFKIPMATESIKTLAVNQVLEIAGEIESIEEVSDIVLISFNEKNTVKDTILLSEDIRDLKKTWDKSGQQQIIFKDGFNMTLFRYHLYDKDKSDEILNSKESDSRVTISAKVFYDRFYVNPCSVHFNIDSIYEIK